MNKQTMRSKMLFSFLAMALAVVPVSALAAQVSATVNVTPETSTTLGIIPVHPAQPANSYFYDYNVTDGGSIVDSVPVELCLNQSTGIWSTFNVTFHEASGSLPGVTVPVATAFIPTSTCTTVIIDINTGALKLTDPTVPETFVANINIQPKDKSPSNLSVNTFPTIHIRASVAPAEKDTSCFITDGNGNLLATCDGSTVTASGSDAGRFSINVNSRKNIEVSTDPGQFYYNILWENKTGAAKTVSVNFAGTDVIVKGAQAIHAYAFPPSFSGVTQADFQLVNEGIPGGSAGTIPNITVPAGWTLWANYHVEWSGIGSTVPEGIATICDTANQLLSITGTISGGVERTCTAGAKGFKK